MDLRVLEYFLTVAEEGNISHAAGLLHVSQPTVSRQLMDLEEELGKKLFLRTNKNVTLTRDGLLFRQTARDILSLYQKAVHQSAEILSGDLYIGTGETPTFSFLARQIQQFHEMYPQVKIHIISENAERIFDDIDKGLLDLGFVMQSVNTAKYQFMDLGLEETWGVLVPESHPLAKKERVSRDDLREEMLILPENLAFQGEICQWLGDKDTFHVACTSNLGHNSAVLMRAGLGLVIGLNAPGPQMDGGVFVPLEDVREASASLVWKRTPVQSPAMEKFLEQCSQARVL